MDTGVSIVAISRNLSYDKYKIKTTKKNKSIRSILVQIENLTLEERKPRFARTKHEIEREREEEGTVKA